MWTAFIVFSFLGRSRILLFSSILFKFCRLINKLVSYFVVALKGYVVSEWPLIWYNKNYSLLLAKCRLEKINSSKSDDTFVEKVMIWRNMTLYCGEHTCGFLNQNYEIQVKNVFLIIWILITIVMPGNFVIESK